MEFDPDALQLLPAPGQVEGAPTTCGGITCDTGATCGVTCPVTN